MGDNIVKTALEKALERAAAMPKVSDEQLEKMEYFPQGQAFAGKYLYEGADLATALTTVEEKHLQFIKAGVSDTLLKNLNLPADEETLKTSKKALQGFYQITQDHQALEQIIAELEQLFMYYQQLLDQTKASVKSQLMQQFQAAQQQLAEQYGGQVEIDIESQPEFHSELAKVLGQLNQRFEEPMQVAKAKIKQLI